MAPLHLLGAQQERITILTWTVSQDDNDTIHVRAIISPDQKDEIHALITALTERDGALAPDWRGTGTNAVALNLQRLADAPFRFSFGEGSFLRHLKEFRSRGLSQRTVRRPGLALDIDEPPSLRRMATQFRVAAGV